MVLLSWESNPRSVIKSSEGSQNEPMLSESIFGESQHEESQYLEYSNSDFLFSKEINKYLYELFIYDFEYSVLSPSLLWIISVNEYVANL